MDDLIRQRVEARGAWASKEGSVVLEPLEMDRDYAARVIALLVERAGGRVELTHTEIEDVPSRLVLLPEDAEDGFNFETRTLASASTPTIE